MELLRLFAGFMGTLSFIAGSLLFGMAVIFWASIVLFGLCFLLWTNAALWLVLRTLLDIHQTQKEMGIARKIYE